MNMKKHMMKWVSLMVGISVPFVAIGQNAANVPAPEVQGAQAKISELEQEFRSISEKLSKIEMQAMGNNEVAEAKESFNSMVEKEVIRTKPEIEDAVRERGKYAEYIEEVQSGGDLPEDVDLNEVYSKYNALHQQVMPVEQEVMQKEKLQEAYQEYQQKLVTQMRSIDPKVMDYLERQREIRNEYQEIVSGMQS